MYCLRPYELVLNKAISCLNNLGWGTGQPTHRIRVRSSHTWSHPFPASTAGGSFFNPLVTVRIEESPFYQEAKNSVRCLLGQRFHLLDQLASSRRETSSTGFLFLFLRLLGWGKRLSLRLGPPLPSSAALPPWLGPIAAARTCPGWRRAVRARPGCAQRRRALGVGAGAGAGRLAGPAPPGEAESRGGRTRRRDGRRAKIWRCPPDAPRWPNYSKMWKTRSLPKCSERETAKRAQPSKYSQPGRSPAMESALP